MFDPNNRLHLSKLRGSIAWSRKQLESARKKAYELWKKLVGCHYVDGQDSKGPKTPIGLLERAHTTYVRLLAASAPQVTVVGLGLDQVAIAADGEAAINKEIEDQELEDELQDWVGDSLMGLSIIKVGVKLDRYVVDDFDEEHGYGAAYITHISQDDWCHDMKAKKWKACRYMGHRYYVPLSEARQRKDWDEKARGLLVASQRKLTEKGVPTLASLGRQETNSDDAELEESVEVWEFYLAKENLIVTLSLDTGDDAPALESHEHQGPPRHKNPFTRLAYKNIPGNTNPLAPAQNWVDLHDSANMGWNKVDEQAKASKQILVGEEGAEQELQTIAGAQNLAAITVGSVDKVKLQNISPIDPTVMAHTERAKELFNEQAGNIDLLAGLGPSSDTATQDTLLSQGANGRIEAMRDTVYHATRRVMTQFAWYLWNDPLRTYEAERMVPGTEIPVSVSLAPADRQGNWGGLDLKIVPGSMQRMSAPQRLAKVLQYLTQIVMPIDPMRINLDALLALISRYEQIPELLQVLQSNPSALELQSPEQGLGKPPVTNRVTTRRSVAAGPTAGAKANTRIQALMAGGNRPAEQRL